MHVDCSATPLGPMRIFAAGYGFTGGVHFSFETRGTLKPGESGEPGEPWKPWKP